MLPSSRWGLGAVYFIFWMEKIYIIQFKRMTSCGVCTLKKPVHSALLQPPPTPRPRAGSGVSFLPWEPRERLPNPTSAFWRIHGASGPRHMVYIPLCTKQTSSSPRRKQDPSIFHPHPEVAWSHSSLYPNPLGGGQESQRYGQSWEHRGSFCWHSWLMKNLPGDLGTLEPRSSLEQDP